MNIFSPTMNTRLLILFSFLVALVLMFLQLPTWLDWFRPQWVVLVVLYWGLMMPKYVNVGIAWLVGFFLDIVYNLPMGGQALALVIAVYFMIKFREWLMQLSFWQMSLVIFGLVMLIKSLPFLLQIYLGNYFNAWTILNCALVSALIWPFLSWLLFNYQLKFRM